jgi:hypothetical protein
VITTKWPRLVVAGQPVTEDQADHIVVRTNSWMRRLFSNDKPWQSAVEALVVDFGYPPESHSHATQGVNQIGDRWRRLGTWCDRLGILNLHYLHNDRVMSTWVGGSHGWCDWDGTIGCTSYNIGKWPSDDEVTEDWQKIAAAFPFLDLTAQVIDDEGAGPLAAQWRIGGGTIVYDPEPTELLAAPSELSEAQVVDRFTNPLAERGVDLDRLRAAFERVVAEG